MTEDEPYTGIEVLDPNEPIRLEPLSPPEFTGLSVLIRTGYVDAQGDIITPDTEIIVPTARWVPLHEFELLPCQGLSGVSKPESGDPTQVHPDEDAGSE